uniref:CUB domain-containing protein n=1 Tax=Parastrongyloides trichosuri TaxID=131310 RepID=A0A0N4ZPM3_PARTI
MKKYFKIIIFFYIFLLFVTTNQQTTDTVVTDSSVTSNIIPSEESTLTTPDSSSETTGNTSVPSIQGSTTTTISGSQLTKSDDSTIIPSTKEEITTVPTTPYIVEDVYADFSMTCDNISCIYSIQSPALSQDWIKEIQDLYNSTGSDREEYKKDKITLLQYKYNETNLCNISFYEQQYNDLLKQYTDLQAKINQFNTLYTQLSVNATQMSKDFENIIPSSCYYYCKDFIPQSTTIGTTTNSQSPVSDPCSTQTCEGIFNDNTYNGTCQVKGFSSYCLCPGNLDPYKNCDDIGCYSTLNGKPDMQLNGPIWSPGYYGKVLTNTTYNKNMNCQWQITNLLHVQNLSLNVNKFNIGDGSSLTVTTDILSISFTNIYDVDTIKTTIDSMISGTSFIKMKFKSGSKVNENVNNYFDFYLSGVYPSTTTKTPTTTTTQSVTTSDQCDGEWVTVDGISENDEYYDEIDAASATPIEEGTTQDSQTTPLGVTTFTNQPGTQDTVTPNKGVTSLPSTQKTVKVTKRICVTRAATLPMSTSPNSNFSKDTTPNDSTPLSIATTATSGEDIKTTEASEITTENSAITKQ